MTAPDRFDSMAEAQVGPEALRHARVQLADLLRRVDAEARAEERGACAAHIREVFLSEKFRASGFDRAADVVHRVTIETIAQSVARRATPKRNPGFPAPP